nr:hypothetical protein [Thermoproteota archaeon]
AMHSPVTRERYSTRLRSFFAFIGSEGSTMNERCRWFIAKVKENEENSNSKWAYTCVVRFLQHQKDRYDKDCGEFKGMNSKAYRYRLVTYIERYLSLAICCC